MCSIIGSFNKSTVLDLCELNSYRGQHSHSISYFDTTINKFTSIQRKLGQISYDAIDIPDNHYCVIHMQAPTTDSKSSNNIHPAEIDSNLLWHNGIIKEKEIQQLNALYDINITWDTYILLHHMVHDGIPEIDGSFSCLYYDDYRMYLFRNEISPMFIDDKMNISSTKFPDSYPTPPNQMLLFEPHLNILQNVFRFSTIENPYYFGE